jgi:hypothetical protein
MSRQRRWICAFTALASACSGAYAQDVSASAMLQWFDGSWRTMERRAPDIFMAGYGSVWIPPGSRADSGNQSVGYDVYDRFDLGSAGNPTLYGTETGLKTAISEMRRAGISTYADVVWNHNGFRDHNTPGFINQGAYPGMVVRNGVGGDYGDFHAPQGVDGTGGSVLNGRLAGLIDIDPTKNNTFVRNPVPGQVNNIPAGTIANIPSESNRRFYQDRSGPPARMLFNPMTGENNIAVYDFTPGTAATGDPVAENAIGYLMRHTQWLVQEIGVDGFRLDATKHIPAWVLDNYFDQSVFRSNPRLNLDGSTRHVFSFGENFDGGLAFLQTYVRKDINPNDPGRIGGNRDTKDFPFFFAVQANLSSNGLQNDWRNLVNASFDVNDDGLANNGSQGVAFVQSHDSFGPALSNVAHAYMLTRPGNAIVYFNGKEFGSNRDFPKDGRGDALGGTFGSTITTLTNLRNTHGRGNYLPRLTQKETFIVEREKSMVAAFSNRTDAGFDTRTVQTTFTPGTRLLELTGNANDSTVDPSNQIADFVIVDSLGRITVNVPRNRTGTTDHGKGYVIYGLATPQGVFSVDGLATTLPPQSANASNNGTARLAPIDVVTADTFTLRLQTSAAVVGGVSDADSGGDNALLFVNEGVDVNRNGQVDFRSPGSVAYAGEQFVTKRSPLTSGGDGEYRQLVHSDDLIEGFNYVEVRAFRRRTDGGPAVYSSFRKVVYVDREKPEVALDSINGSSAGTREFRFVNDDVTADSVHLILNQPATVTDAQALALVGSSNRLNQIDRNLWSRSFATLPTGSYNLLAVTYEITGNVNIQRQTGLFINTGRGLGFGDLDGNGAFNALDLTGGPSSFEGVMNNVSRFAPAGDVNADGLTNTADLWLLDDIYLGANATAAYDAWRDVVVRRGDLNLDAFTDADDIDLLFSRLDTTPSNLFRLDLNADGMLGTPDVDLLVRRVLLSDYGDANLDQTVGFADLLALAQNFNLPGAWSQGDFTGDAIVGFDDLLLLAQNYDTASAIAADLGRVGFGHYAPLVIPEPFSLSLLGVVLMSLRRPVR